MFQENRETQDIHVTDKEYNSFCQSLTVIPKRTLNRIKSEVQFIVLSQRKDGKEYPACYVNLESKDFKEKKGFIFISPTFFKSKYIDLARAKAMAHEIAHHIKGHCDFSSLDERQKAEKAADKLAEKWLASYLMSLSDE